MKDFRNPVGVEADKNAYMGKTMEIILDKDPAVGIMMVEIFNMVIITTVTVNTVTVIGMVA